MIILFKSGDYRPIGRYQGEPAGRAAMRRANRAEGWETRLQRVIVNEEEWEWCRHRDGSLGRGPYSTMRDFDFEAKYNPMIKVKSLMSGVEVEIRRLDQGNPALDPSMEGYWTM